MVITVGELKTPLPIQGKLKAQENRSPDVLVNKKRAFVRFARPSMFKVPWNEVLIVFTALNW
jgi:hypothetical protein